MRLPLSDMSWPAVAGVRIHPDAQARLVEISAQAGGPAILCLGVEGGGCSGFQYTMEMGVPNENDAVVLFGPGGCAGVSIDPVSAPLLEGAVLAYEDNLAGQRFVVENPKAVAGCGCGVSFAI